MGGGTKGRYSRQAFHGRSRSMGLARRSSSAARGVAKTIFTSAHEPILATSRSMTLVNSSTQTSSRGRAAREPTSSETARRSTRPDTASATRRGDGSAHRRPLDGRELRRDDPLRIQSAAGHAFFSTKQIYIRFAGELDTATAGTPPPILPSCSGASSRAQRASTRGGARERDECTSSPRFSQVVELNKLVASPAGWEPLGAPVRMMVVA
jgi:hypothetical protein